MRGPVRTTADSSLSRRGFVAQVMVGGVSLAVSRRMLLAQQPGQPGVVHEQTIVKDSANLFAMDQNAALPVRLPPKPNATPSMTDKERDELEHRIHCQCGCTLDVFTCRTTDFSCQVSPALHRDVMELVKGGYSGQEIIDAFVDVYGERALMAPRKSGFQLLAWVLPGAALVVGAGVLAMLLRSWGERSRARAAAQASAPASSRFTADRGDGDATPDELARLEAAVRGEDDE